jgi:uncharacterized membrane protein YedE/YeeE
MINLFPHAAPMEGLIGGLMIGTAAAMMLLGLGRIAGISGLSAQMLGLAGNAKSRPVAVAFILGLPLGAALMAGIVPIVPEMTATPLMLVIGGLLVGFGTRLGSGCTSGHGVCGLSRLSPRSFAATGLFMAAGFVTVALVRLAGVY